MYGINLDGTRQTPAEQREDGSRCGHQMKWFDGDSQQEPGLVHVNAADILTCPMYGSQR